MLQAKQIAIETSGPRLSLAAADGARLLAQQQTELQWRHAETLFHELQQLLRRMHWQIQDVTGVAVCVGPGSFTGIRIGLAAARALGQALRIPVVGIHSLEAIAHQSADKQSILCPVLDAQSGGIYAAAYEAARGGALRVVARPYYGPPEPFFKSLRRIAQGRSVREIRDAAPEASSIWTLARARLARATPDSGLRVFPFYLRPPAAVERRRRS